MRAIVVALAMLTVACGAPHFDADARWWHGAGYTQLEYASRPSAALHLYVRATDERGVAGPAVLLFHGGGWFGGSPKDLVVVADRIAADGYAVLIAEYGVEALHRATPIEALEDAVAAYDYIVDNADVLRIDRERVAVWGRSVGAYLAFWVARGRVARPHPPCGLVFIGGVVDTSLQGYRPPPIARLSDPLSPLDAIVPGMPPLYLLHGGADHFTPGDTARRFAQNWRAAGNVVVGHVADGVRHGFYFGYDGNTAIDLGDSTLYPDSALEFLARECASVDTGQGTTIAP